MPRYFRDTDNGDYLRVDMRLLRNRRLIKAGALYRAFVVNPVSRDSSFEVITKEFLATKCEPLLWQALPLSVKGVMGIKAYT